jgi:signal peptidase II
MPLRLFFKNITREPSRYFLLAAVAGTVVLLDQVTKTMIQRAMQIHESIPVVRGLFSLTYIRNTGAAFGLFAGRADGLRMAFFGTVSVIAIVFLWTLFAKTPRAALSGRLAIALVMGGAMGNLLDRIRYGEVVDFLDFYVGPYHWPAFNVADSCISVGVALMVWHFIRADRRSDGSDRSPAAHA